MLAVAIAVLGLVGGVAGITVAIIALIATGITAGLLLIPLNAALQHESDPAKLGKAIAVQNFTDYCSMLLGAGFMQALTLFGFGANRVFVALGVVLAVIAIALRAPTGPEQDPKDLNDAKADNHKTTTAPSRVEAAPRSSRDIRST